MRSPTLSSAIARSPLGVAMGVFGAVHTHCAQPSGHVPLSVAVVQAVREASAFTLQQSSPDLQHSASQQVVVPEHVTPAAVVDVVAGVDTLGTAAFEATIGSATGSAPTSDRALSTGSRSARVVRAAGAA